MKKITIILLFVFLCSTIQAQNEALNAIKEDFIAYNKKLKNKDLEIALDYVLPEFFSYFPREEMLKGMKLLMQDESMKYVLDDPIINEIKPLTKSNSKYYSLIDYNGNFAIQFKQSLSLSNDELQKFKAYYLQNFDKTFGKENVSFDETTKFFKIKSKNYIIAVSNNGKDTWKFLQIDPNLGEIYTKIIPKDILEKYDIIK